MSVSHRNRASAPKRDSQRVPWLPSAEMGAITRLCYYDPLSCCNRSVVPQLKSDLQSFLGRNDIDPSSPCPGSLSRLFKHGIYLVVVMLGAVVKHH